MAKVIKSLERQVPDVVRKLNKIFTTEIPLAEARALNRTLDAGTTKLRRYISRAKKIPVRKVGSRLEKRRARASHLEAFLNVDLQGVAAIKLPNVKDKGRYRDGHRGRVGTGVSARGHRWSNAFVAAGSGGKRHVFRRKANKSLEAIRISIKEEAEEKAEPILQSELIQNYALRLNKEMKYRLGKYSV